MPSSRRLKTIALAIAVIFCFILFVGRDTTTQEFYTRTVAALDKKHASDAEAASKWRTIKDPAKNQEPISDGNTAQKPLDESSDDGEQPHGEPEKYPKTESKDEEGDEKSVAGRKKMKGEGHKSDRPHKSKEERQVEAEMNSILKRGPSTSLPVPTLLSLLQGHMLTKHPSVIIFSKTWCPYSAKAKRILTDKYHIVPAPHIVELDQHPLGGKIQDVLEKTTGRRTVPNILINGRSVGGGDDIEAAEIAGTLVEKIQNMGGKRLTITKMREGD
ncbi:uncharacterized protein KY384_002240 [Bacidia gigantensis]|uniref:uncharacterized protein n=1 Tax=Bacidia gigantensis TaxID=2732470 RepID=UPI001D059254|nr:uncharacterized protein KY384_002240 [Bacidia gigantensis]KAG8533457.1 hypothetical protein KY384_002240 [Bacidia gigantensis]